MSQLEQGTVVTYRTGQALLAEFEATGAEQAFEEIVRLYAGMVYSVCHQVTKNAHDAEDSAQATFLSLATQVKTGKHVKCLGPWLRQVAKRTSLDLCKSRKRREKREENHGRLSGQDRFNGNLGEANLESQDYKQALHEELSKLPTRYRLPLVMHYFGGLPPEQTALELNCKPKTLAVRLHRGRKMLAAQLSRRGIFVGGEMLGIAAAPVMLQMMGEHAIHSTAHAAVGLTNGHDITALISGRVMGLMKLSAQTAIFAKIKFLAVIAVLASTMLAGSAQAMRGSMPQILEKLHLPSLKFDMSRWLKPMIRSLLPENRVIAQNDTNAAAISVASTSTAEPSGTLVRNVIVTVPMPASLAQSVQFASYSTYRDTQVVPAAMQVQSGPRASDFDGMITLTDPLESNVADAAVQLRLAAATMPSQRQVTMISADGTSTQWIDPSGSLSTAGVQPRPMIPPGTPAPEPVGVAFALAGASFFLRRRPASK